jgi:hypothetical protein
MDFFMLMGCGGGFVPVRRFRVHEILRKQLVIFSGSRSERDWATALTETWGQRH